MLKPSHEFYTDPLQARVMNLLSDVIAQEYPPVSGGYPDRGAVLIVTRGRTRIGTGFNYVVRSTAVFSDPNYKRRKFKANSDREAIEHANKILAKWRKESEKAE